MKCLLICQAIAMLCRRAPSDLCLLEALDLAYAIERHASLAEAARTATFSRLFLADGSVLPLQDFLKPCLQTNFLKVRYRGDLINNSLTSESTH
jgi:hypothetical protein